MNSTVKLIQNVVPKSQIAKVKAIRFSLAKKILFFFRSYRLTSSLYYALFSKAFDREHQSVLYGRVEYLKSSNNNLNCSYLVRRNIHRLEKGLIMRPRREIFATNYIEETVAGYRCLLNSKNIDLTDDELKWAHDVLNEYFKVVKFEPHIEKVKQEFLGLKSINEGNKYIPYKRDLSGNPVSYEQFLKLCWQRRSVRWYLSKKVPRELIDKSITAACLSPSACNRQPFEFRVFDEPEMVQKISDISWGTRGFNHNFPTIVIVIGKLNAYFSERDRHIIYIDASLASMSLMFALETLGLSSCPINWPEIESWDVQISDLINLKPYERVIMLLSIGYPDPEGMVPYSKKKSLDKIRRYS